MAYNKRNTKAFRKYLKRRDHHKAIREAKLGFASWTIMGARR